MIPGTHCNYHFFNLMILPQSNKHFISIAFPDQLVIGQEIHKIFIVIVLIASKLQWSSIVYVEDTDLSANNHY